MQIAVVIGDITCESCDAIVNAANTSLLGGGGVDGAIHRIAGPGLLEECRTLNGCETGQAKITKGYNLPAKYVIHTPGPVWEGGQNHEEALLASCYRSSLDLAKRHDCQCVAFPSISTGVYHFPLEKAATIAISTILDDLIGTDSMIDVRFVCFDRQTKDAYDQSLQRQLIDRLSELCSPDNWTKMRRAEAAFIDLSNSIATNIGKWPHLGSYGDYIERSGEAINRNITMSQRLDLNTCIATLVCIHREQHWNGGWSDVITPRVMNGGIMKLASRLREMTR